MITVIKQEPNVTLGLLLALAAAPTSTPTVAAAAAEGCFAPSPGLLLLLFCHCDKVGLLAPDCARLSISAVQVELQTVTQHAADPWQQLQQDRQSNKLKQNILWRQAMMTHRSPIKRKE